MMNPMHNIRVFGRSIDEIDKSITSLLQKYSHKLLRYSLGIIFFWFGALKLINKSPANELVEKTVFWFPSDIFIPILGFWEVAIGVFLLIRKLNRVAIFLLMAQMVGTFLPLVLLPQITFSTFPFVPTLEGQYIIKNLVLISAALVIGSNVRETPEDKYL